MIRPFQGTRQFERALVAGGAGFLGSHLCERLLADNTAVVCVDNFATGDHANIARLRGHPKFTLLEHDMVEPLRMPGRFDLVLHLASAASPAQYLRLPIETMRAGAIGTMRALELAEEHSARFLLTSTSEIYGDPLEHPQRETYRGNVNPVGPRSVYDEAKRFAEAATMAYRRDRGTDTAIARIFNTYGPRMSPEDGRMIPTFIRQALCGQPLTIQGTGEHTRSICYVDDTVRGLLMLARSDHPGPVNVGSQQELPVREIAAVIKELTDTLSPVHRIEAAEDDPRRRCPDITLAREALGWEPKVGLRDGLRLTIDWFAQEAATNTGMKDTA